LDNTLSKSILDPLTMHLIDPMSRMGFQVHPPTDPDKDGIIEAADERTKLAFVAVWGLLSLDHVKPEDDRFMNEVAVKLGEYTTDQDLFEKVLDIMVSEAKTNPATAEAGNGNSDVLQGVDAVKWVSVGRILRDEGIKATDSYLSLKTKLAIARAVGLGEGAAPSSIEIDLPDLEARADVDIQENNLRAVEAIYFSAMLEEVKFFQVVDKLIELFQKGMLPIGKGNAGDKLYDYWRKSVTRFTEIERHNLYFRVFGFPGGDATLSNPNREFTDLWMRFVSAVSSLLRQIRVDQMLRTSLPPLGISQGEVRKAGRDLAANLSLHGYGVAHFAATDLQNQVNDIIAILSEPEIKNAYGARDMYQVIEQVSIFELGGAKNGTRYRSLATSGAIIIAWLAKNAHDLCSAHKPLFDIQELTQQDPNYSEKPMKDPNNADLLDACQTWLATTGTAEQSIEQYAQPVESPNITSRPIQIPDFAKEALESVGVGVNKNGKGAIAA
jgi:hypothetical protein